MMRRSLQPPGPECGSISSPLGDGRQAEYVLRGEDVPLPSIENDPVSELSSSSTPSIAINTPSESPQPSNRSEEGNTSGPPGSEQGHTSQTAPSLIPIHDNMTRWSHSPSGSQRSFNFSTHSENGQPYVFRSGNNPVRAPGTDQSSEESSSWTPPISVSMPSVTPPRDIVFGSGNRSASPGSERDQVESLGEGVRGLHLASRSPGRAGWHTAMDTAGLRDALPGSPGGGTPRTPARDLSPSLPFRPGSRAGGRMGATGASGSSRDSRGSLSPTPQPQQAGPWPSLCPSPARHRRSSSQALPMRHEVDHEEPPPDRFYDAEVQRALADAQSVAQDLASVLGRHPLNVDQDSPIWRLSERAGELARFRCPPTRTVGLVGDSGVGKSSLLNSLLDCDGLARATNNGAACTCVVTEYWYHDRDGFAVEVEPFSQSEIREQLTEMVHAYCQRLRRSAGSEDAQDSDDAENSDVRQSHAEDARHWEERAAVAEDSFRAMFEDRFTPALFQQGRSEESIVRTLVGWAQELSPVNANTREIRSSVRDCSSLLAQLTSNAGPSGGAPVWRYIKKVKVFLKAYILSKGLILVDLPGLHDLNSARRNITERYIVECNEIFAVCNTGRATTDQGVMSVFELARRADLSNVGIICTRSDDVKAEEEVREHTGAAAVRLRHLIQLVRDAERRLAPVGQELAELNAILDGGDELFEQEEARRIQLLGEKDRIERTLERRKVECHRTAMELRNATVTAGLMRTYADRIPGGGGQLRVFCASNTLYWEWRDKPADRALPFLRQSGILAIRQHCLGLVSESQLRLAMQYMHRDVQELVSNVDLWVRSGAGGTADLARAREVRRVLDGVEARLRGDFTGVHSPIMNLDRWLSRRFGEDVYQQRRTREWTREAVKAGLVWNGWHHATYAAFCRNYGHHNTDAVGFHDWNEEAMAAMSDALSAVWRTFYPVILDRLDRVLETISDSLEWAVNRLEAVVDGYRSDSLHPLRIALTSRQHSLVFRVEDICDKFEEDLRTLRTDALRGHRTSFYGRGMEGTYNRAIAEYGSGSWGRKKAIINAALGNEQLLAAVMRKFRDGFGELAAALQAEVRAVVASDLDVIKDTLGIVRNESAAPPSEEELAFRARVADEIRTVRQRLDHALARAPESTVGSEGR